ncbi:hypothetical protein L3X38_024837 [Prunus dulcis]|uniref:Reverse transcriptase zinc-binding domain-containing protein n=1 Tax=Prunus dulcis TaxID=3755 RepID=A0AAD4Z6W3_PRUDU|nr:hypothetical protein L3X38_024837 [Prunus dulcis]
MNSCCRRFFWGNSIKVPLVAWKDICLPQSLGGLGVKSAALFNKAALAKLGWICLTDSSNWWAQIMLKKYLKNEGFLVTAKKTSHSSTWKAILEARFVLHKGIRWIVGNGQSIPFWTANWVFPFPLLDLIHVFLRNNLNLNAKVSDFIQNQAWNYDKLSQVIDDDVIEKILTIPLPFYPLQDKLIWGPAPNGNFSIKSAYNLQVQDEQSHPKAPILKKMWSLILPPKVKLFSWLLIRKRLQVRSHLYKFLPNINPECPLCKNHMETINHLFFKCQFALNIWRCTYFSLTMLIRILMALSGWLCYLIPRLPMAHMFFPKLFFYAGKSGKPGTTAFLKTSIPIQLEPSLTPSRLWDRGLPLSCSVPFYFDLVGPACPRGFRL